MDFYKHGALGNSTRHIHFSFVYLLAIVFSYHTLLVSYNTSSFIGVHLSPAGVGLLFGLGALGSSALFLLFPRLLSRTGNVMLGLGIMAMSVASLLLLAFSHTPFILMAALGIFLVINPLLYLVIDIFSETLIGASEGGTGSKRGLTLALMSAAAVFAPLSMAMIMGEDGDHTQLFLAAAGVGLLFMAIIIGIFRQFYDPPYITTPLPTLLSSLHSNTNIKTVAAAHFLLQLFFAWIIIYVPLYLSSVVGFDWQDIGYIIAAGLAAYVLFEYPIGLLADRYLGEQEMMSLGFVLLAVTTALFAYLSTASILAWMGVMFINRIGASLVEVTTESYFFKQVDGGDAPLMSVFRLLRPAANVAGALIGSIALFFVSFPIFFIIGGSILVIGVFIPRYLVDTR